MPFPVRDFLDLEQTDHADLFADPEEPAWSALARIASHLEARIDRALEAGRGLVHGEVHPSAEIGPRVWIDEGTVVEANAVIQGPAWIGRGTTVRSNAYLRQNVIAGNDSILGNACEFKNCVLFNKVEIPHFNYVGDSLLGHRAHLGAGVICSNVRLDRQPVRVCDAEGAIHKTGLQKFGAIVGDRTEVGCNSVLSPGSLLGRDGIIYPNTSWRGFLPASSIGRHPQELEVHPRPVTTAG